MKNVIRKHKKEWFKMIEANAVDVQIQQHIQKLDDITIKVETKWGVDRLPLLVSPETQNKWRTQWRKLNDAIINKNLNDLIGLVDGTIRGYSALEAEAIAAGHQHNTPDVWDYQHPESGRKYRFCKNLPDARAAVEKDVVVYSLMEVANILEGQQLVNVVKDEFPGAVVEKCWREAEIESQEIPF